MKQKYGLKYTVPITWVRGQYQYFPPQYQAYEEKIFL